ncbi:MAG TPA: hypothetical protein VLD55_07815, partial [Candidatus Sulfobium mesophilum]|nr:hypothetical protein [Candidatus Sulfobium mesophilum]
MKNIAFVYDDIFLRHETPPGHPESKDRLVAITDALKKADLWERLIHLSPLKATREDILLVHTASYYE